MAVYALTIFLGAFLLFQIQPLIGKFILPWYGGGPGVWTVCMLFFQVLLLAGYAYAHVCSRYLKPRVHGWLHALLLLAAIASLPITPSLNWKPVGPTNPTLSILLLLGATVGLPYFVLSSTGPLVQEWFGRKHPGKSPYPLYALSNAGSLLALVSFPFFFEPHWTRSAQAQLWGWGFVVFGLCCGFLSVRLNSSPLEKQLAEKQESAPDRSPETVPSTATRLLWFALPACASVLLLATTNKLCQDVAAVPLLWVLPLAIYLLSFILSFASERWYPPFYFSLALIASLSVLCWLLYAGTGLSIRSQCFAYAAALFLCCMFCHGELYRIRPASKWLTSFYLTIAAGGAAGGCFVALLAPLLFRDYFEFHWGLLTCGILFVLVRIRDASGLKPWAWRFLACLLPVLAFAMLDWMLRKLGASSKEPGRTWVIAIRITMWAMLAGLAFSWLWRGKIRTFQYWRFLTCLWLTFACGVLAITLWINAGKSKPGAIYRSRNFYGVLTVYERRPNDPKQRHLVLQHGRITHGLQFTHPDRKTWATSYYSPDSGIGLAFSALTTLPRRIGVIGLGTGSLAVYAEPLDYLRIYEINPEVVALARSEFSYISDCPAQVEIALGDARLSMEREPPQNFDILALDAFSSDSIPIHLLTKEAFAQYERHLKEGGIIAVHISNHFLDLEPVVAGIANQFGYHMGVIDFDDDDDQWWFYSSTWVLLSKSAEIFSLPEIETAMKDADSVPADGLLWTDDFSSIYQILK